ncbi:hypothetical protein PLESTF_000538500 [Pleodorina starrii]|nr:hypothetical protein PLESTF_000538500 [Pleodorina starrii]
MHHAVELMLDGSGGGGGGSGGRQRWRRLWWSLPPTTTNCHMAVLQGGPHQLDGMTGSSKLPGQRWGLLQDARGSIGAFGRGADCMADWQCNKLHGYDGTIGRRHGCGGGSSTAAAMGLVPPGTTHDVARKRTRRVFEGGTPGAYFGPREV